MKDKCRHRYNCSTYVSVTLHCLLQHLALTWFDPVIDAEDLVYLIRDLGIMYQVNLKKIPFDTEVCFPIRSMGMRSLCNFFRSSQGKQLSNVEYQPFNRFNSQLTYLYRGNNVRFYVKSSWMMDHDGQCCRGFLKVSICKDEFRRNLRQLAWQLIFRRQATHLPSVGVT